MCFLSGKVGNHKNDEKVLLCNVGRGVLLWIDWAIVGVGFWEISRFSDCQSFPTPYYGNGMAPPIIGSCCGATPPLQSLPPSSPPCRRHLWTSVVPRQPSRKDVHAAKSENLTEKHLTSQKRKECSDRLLGRWYEIGRRNNPREFQFRERGLRMCRPRSPPPVCYVRARRVVKKYRKLSLRKEMRRLRRLLPGGALLKKEEVIEETVALIQALEQKLVDRLRKGTLPQALTLHPNASINDLREAVLRTMMLW